MFGQSAGSASVCALTTAALAKGLFHKAIGQSASCLLPPRGTDITGLSSAQSLVKWLEQQATGKLALRPSEDKGSWLRRLPTPLVQRAATNSGWMSGPKITLDGKLLTQHPSRVFAQGKQTPLPLLVGSLANEGHQLFPLPQSLTQVQLQQQLQRRYGSAAAELLAAYETELANSPGLAAREITTDEFMAFAMRRWAQANTAAGAPSYLYFMSQPTPAFALYTPERPKLKLPEGSRSAGAYHSGDLAYVFDNTRLVGLDWNAADPQACWRHGRLLV